ncbi:isoform 2 of ankyrin-3 [Acrodontium crateriforme]|uniref:Isoform 2 of ankyrin-3 n=1 Tax=Acrodontium crateriforme TaxID=150365 RepID=A0AAQ3MAW9_9PEZI|nr:isoform 2 of ankyrin-3 [Acrodontium crateriforme]
MDPVSIITVLQWTAQASFTLYDFIGTIRSAPDEMTLLSRETHALYGALRSLKVALRNPEVKAYVRRNRALEEDLTSLGSPLRLCEHRVGELMRKLEDCTEVKSDGTRRVKSVKWYFVKGDVLALKTYLGDIRNTVAFTVGNNHFLETLRVNAAAGTVTNTTNTDHGLEVPIAKGNTASRTPSPVLEDRIKELQKQGSLLRRAALDGDNRAIELLLDAGVPVDSKSFEGRTALSRAAEHGNIESARLLLERGAFVSNIQNTMEGNRYKRAESKRTPLHWAATNGHTAVCELLLAHGADLDARSVSQRTPIMEAGIANHLPAVEMLLSKGADVNTRTYYGWTLLHTAASGGKTELAAFLLRHGADTEATYTGTWHGEGKGDEGATQQRPLHYAVRPTRRPLGGDETILIEMLVRDGKAKIDAQDSAGSTPLHYAVRSGWKEAVGVLIKYASRRDLETVNGDGRTALDEAHESGNADMAFLLRS